MAYYVSPQNDLDRITQITHSVHSGVIDSEKGKMYIAPKTLTTAQDLLPKMKMEMESLSKEEAERAANVVEKNDSFKVVCKYLRHLWSAARNRVDRENLSVDVLKFYQLPLTGITPNIHPAPSVIDLAETVIAGDAQAVEAGYAPMTNPSAEELRAVVDIAKKEYADVLESDSEVDDQEAKLAELREQADRLIRKVVADLRYFLSEEDEPSQRRIMRRYGMVFRSELQESTE